MSTSTPEKSRTQRRAEALKEAGWTPLHREVRRLADQLRHWPQVCPRAVVVDVPLASPWKAPRTKHRPFKVLEAAE